MDNFPIYFKILRQNPLFLSEINYIRNLTIFKETFLFVRFPASEQFSVCHSRPSTKFILSETNVLRINSSGNPFSRIYFSNTKLKTCPQKFSLLLSSSKERPLDFLIPYFCITQVESLFGFFHLASPRIMRHQGNSRIRSLLWCLKFIT